jgi:hypothetical protein
MLLIVKSVQTARQHSILYLERIVGKPEVVQAGSGRSVPGSRLLEIVQDCRIGEIHHKLLMVNRTVGDSEVIQFGVGQISTGKPACRK